MVAKSSTCRKAKSSPPRRFPKSRKRPWTIPNLTGGTSEVSTPIPHISRRAHPCDQRNCLGEIEAGTERRAGCASQHDGPNISVVADCLPRPGKPNDQFGAESVSSFGAIQRHDATELLTFMPKTDIGSSPC